MSWRHEQVTMSRGRLIGAMFAGGCVLASLGLITAILLGTIFDGPFIIYFVWAFLIVMTFSVLVRAIQGVHYLVRRRARLRRMRRVS